ncbi:hypothetical protein STRDD10_00896 [Streptococcus sp. DD10]|uniref:putative quinol monooxygenase n=1 Tax=Streptococcus sp. DD10 TaxID=1777878 RepID=UPI000798280B|nr:antibiotic biosynthesis monooxygenase [Streptococcus sp. DD10]KXT74437.1 hypothetical protein STRDD10_00896 [Streptococcus sp. DD10]
MKPIVHLFHLSVAPADVHDFHEAGVYNLMTSQRQETGTLAMYASRFKDFSTEFIVFEVYADEVSYQTHRASPQFQYYVDKVGGKLLRKDSFEVEAVFLEEKLSTGEWLGKEEFCLKFAKVETTKEGIVGFTKSVLENMKTSLAVEDGVLAMYAMREVKKPTCWYFYEIYASEEAYQRHRQTPHFQTYLIETEELLVEKQLHDLLNDIAVTKGKNKFLER